MDTVRIAVTGLSMSGKSAFLTSLLWQLAEYESADFVFGSKGSAKIRRFRMCRMGGRNGSAAFPFELYREALTRSGMWPEKTKDCYHLACEYSRTDWQRPHLKRLVRLKFNSGQRIECLDFPGERIADAAVAALDDYGEWSDHVLDHLASHGDYRQAAEPFFEVLKAQPLVGEDVVESYKLTLARLIHAYKPFISPSVFLLDRAGEQAKRLDPEQLAASRLVGLDESCEFAPLSASAREASPKLAAKMARYYRTYRRELALPLFNEIGRCNRLVVLVDVPSLLMGGVGRYNDNRQILLDLFESLRPDSSLGGRLRRLLGLFQGRIDRVALVAAKADLVHPSDLENGRLLSLLKQMTARAKTILDDVEVRTFVCSACQSTRPGNDDHTLIGRLSAQKADDPETEFAVSPLPEQWPEDWSAGEYRFSRVLASAPRNLQIPPRHLGLDKIFHFLTTEKPE
jgi:predicted YcjX-like family ATPase